MVQVGKGEGDVPARVILGVAFVAVILVAVSIWAGALASSIGDRPVDASAYARAIDAALADYAVNNDAADSAPKQQVVNGWIARDLLTVIATQNAASIKAGNTHTALLSLLIVAVALLGFAAVTRSQGRPQTEPTEPASAG